MKHPESPEQNTYQKTRENSNEVTIADFQSLIHKMYFEKDVERGIEGTFMWLMEEIGELSSALRKVGQTISRSRKLEAVKPVISDAEAEQIKSDRQNLGEEFADVLAWLVTIANVAEIDLSEEIYKKYGRGCPGCNKFVCDCADELKP